MSAFDIRSVAPDFEPERLGVLVRDDLDLQLLQVWQRPLVGGSNSEGSA